MPRRAGASLANSLYIQPPESPSQNEFLLRTHWKWAAFCQFLTTFSPMLNIHGITPNVRMALSFSPRPLLTHCRTSSPISCLARKTSFLSSCRDCCTHSLMTEKYRMWMPFFFRLPHKLSGPASTIGNPPFVSNIWNGILFPILWAQNIQRHWKQNWKNIPQRSTMVNVIQRRRVPPALVSLSYELTAHCRSPWEHLPTIRPRNLKSFQCQLPVFRVLPAKNSMKRRVFLLIGLIFQSLRNSSLCI